MWLDEIVFLLNEARPDVFQPDVNVFQTSRATVPQGDGPYLGIKETGGSPPTKIQNLTKGLPWQGVVPLSNQFPTAQLVFTAAAYQDARDMCDLAYAILINVLNRDVGPEQTFYRSVRPLHEPNDLLVDNKGRPRVALNVIGDKNPSLPVLACIRVDPFPGTPEQGGHVLGFKVRYNMWMVVGGSPTIVARSDNPGVLPDQTLTYDATNSDLEGLGFGSIAFTAYVGAVPSGVDLTIDSGSVVTGFGGITDIIDRPLPSPDPFNGLSSAIRVTP